jgi:hypothetical protein
MPGPFEQGWGRGRLARAVVAVSVLVMLVAMPNGHITIATAQGAGPRDSNDSFDTAVQVTNGTPTSAKIMSPVGNPQDFYWIGVQRGQAVDGYITILPGVTGYDPNHPGKINFDLEVYGPVDHTKPLAWSRTTDQYETVSIIAPFDGKYTFKVYCVNGTGNYTFRPIVYTPPTVSDGNVYTGTNIYGGTIELDGVEHKNDWFRVYLKGGDPAQTVNASVSHDATGNININLEDLWAKNMLYYVNVSWNTTKTNDVVYGVASYTGFYYIAVTAYTGKGNYQLRIHIGQTAMDNDNYKDQAHLLEYNTTWNDHVNQALDKYDWFFVRLQPKENISLHLTLLDGWHDIFSVFLLDADLNVIIERTNYIFVPKHGTGPEVQFSEIVDGGPYYIVVMAKVALAANPDDLSDSTAAAHYRLVVNMSMHALRPVNKAPMVKPGIQNLTFEMWEDSADHANLNNFFQDPDGDQLLFNATVVDGQLGVSVDLSGLMTILPAMEWFGTGHLNLTAKDPGGLKASLIAKVVVKWRDQPPIVTDYGPARNAKVAEGASQLFWANATDKDDTVVYHNWSVDGVDQHWTNYSMTFKPAYGKAGPHTIIVRISDRVNNATLEWDITVTHTNRGPVILSVLPKNGTGFDAGKKVHLSSGQADPDGDVISWEWRDGAQQLAAGNGNNSYYNGTFSQGRHTLQLMVTDSSGSFATTQVTFTIRSKGVSMDWGFYVVGALIASIIAFTIYAYARSPRKVDKGKWDKDVEKELGRAEVRKGKRKGKKAVDGRKGEDRDVNVEEEVLAERKRRAEKRKARRK